MTATEPLAKLSDHALLAELTRAVGARCQITARLVALVAEVEVRHLHLKAAYSSLYEYCLSCLHLSEGSANRLITAARAARRYPEIIDMIAGGSLHLSGLQLLASYLTPQNHAELLRESAHKTKAEITHIIRTHFPKPDVPASIIASAEQQPLTASEPPPSPPSPREGLPVPPVPHTNAPRVSQQLTPLSAHTFHVQFTANRELHDKLQRARDLMVPRFVRELTWLARPGLSPDLASVVERALDLLISQLEKRKFAKTDKPRASRGRQPGDVSNQTRREVASRDDYRCAFVADDGRRCSARAGLEYDHIDAKARGGGEHATNLRLYCRAHNQLHAIETYGEDFIRAKIHLRQRRSTPMATPHSDGQRVEPRLAVPIDVAPASSTTPLPAPLRADQRVEPRLAVPIDGTPTPSPAPPPSAVALRAKLIHALTHQGFPKPQATRAVQHLSIETGASVTTLLRQAFALLVP